MKTLLNLIAKLGITAIPLDKQAHFIVGFLIALLIFAVTGNLLAPIFLAAFAGSMKEFYDTNKTGFDVSDLLFTVAGALIFVLLATSFMYLF